MSQLRNLVSNRRAIFGLLGLVVLFGCVEGCLRLRKFKRESAVETAREWARLAPLPVETDKLDIEVLGSPFTREFRIQFMAEPEIIAEWLKNSPGPAELMQATPSQTIEVFEIKPGGGASFAKVRVGKNGGWVFIHTYWS